MLPVAVSSSKIVGREAVVVTEHGDAAEALQRLDGAVGARPGTRPVRWRRSGSARERPRLGLDARRRLLDGHALDPDALAHLGAARCRLPQQHVVEARRARPGRRVCGVPSQRLARTRTSPARPSARR